ncbi:DUF3887 domain-containing protein [Evansella cellulosilytica]|uniref:DUF3887 domain-containing protein n=1 Tax=Evansella cellulosilytica (strain ATCC 21833 / DSM 2522 / FERM P-1141 / JCM 9156 / N-4) TaxID=649639 RepID=E6TQB6_EVAC2|nr:DUF3887 domain-containing protein [Evansella cellulosilytica]ADU29294.1 hypothetical protein Bcell_1021 [Evansella cellulosilytica DSM 2522]
MKKYIIMMIITGLLILTGCNSNGGEEQEANGMNGTEENVNGEIEDDNGIDHEQAVAIAEEYISHLSQGDFEIAYDFFNEVMKAEIEVSELGDIWETLESQVGTYIDQDFNSTQEVENYKVVLINGLFDGADVVFTVTIDTNYEIAGFFVQ